ncbi:hypothetical protein T484DRAFT_1755977 [Baffinella frigidus]|nr:hypothetical protein T484DRAFT_1755977 [Cryptophyta sp. CCMP2293]
MDSLDPSTTTLAPIPTTSGPNPNPSLTTPGVSTDANVVFTLTLSMSVDEFTAGMRAAYVSGVARALGVANPAVKITSVSEQLLRRSLLTTSILVETTVSVVTERVSFVVEAAGFENLSRSLRTSNISVLHVSVSRVVFLDSTTETTTTAVLSSTTPGPPDGPLVETLIVCFTTGIAVFVGCFICVFAYRSANKHPGENSSHESSGGVMCSHLASNGTVGCSFCTGAI